MNHPKPPVEGSDVCGTEFGYSIYLQSTPERLWEALTRPSLTRRWWSTTELRSDWRVGSRVVWYRHGVRIDDPGQIVLDYEPNCRLAYTWQSYTAEFAEVVGLSEAFVTAATREHRSKVTFDIEAFDAFVKLVFMHDGFDSGSVVLEKVSERWPLNLSNLKTLLETGHCFSESAAR